MTNLRANEQAAMNSLMKVANRGFFERLFNDHFHEVHSAVEVLTDAIKMRETALNQAHMDNEELRRQLHVMKMRAGNQPKAKVSENQRPSPRVSKGYVARWDRIEHYRHSEDNSSFYLALFLGHWYLVDSMGAAMCDSDGHGSMAGAIQDLYPYADVSKILPDTGRPALAELDQTLDDEERYLSPERMAEIAQDLSRDTDNYLNLEPSTPPIPEPSVVSTGMSTDNGPSRSSSSSSDWSSSSSSDDSYSSSSSSSSSGGSSSSSSDSGGGDY